MKERTQNFVAIIGLIVVVINIFIDCKYKDTKAEKERSEKQIMEWKKQHKMLRKNQLSFMRENEIRKLFLAKVIQTVKTENLYIVTVEKKNGNFFNAISGEDYIAGTDVSVEELLFKQNYLNVMGSIFILNKHP